MIKTIDLEKGAYKFDAKMPLRQAIPLGLQHVFAMFVGNLTPLLIITSACGIAGGEFADLQVNGLANEFLAAEHQYCMMIKKMQEYFLDHLDLELEFLDE